MSLYRCRMCVYMTAKKTGEIGEFRWPRSFSVLKGDPFCADGDCVERDPFCADGDCVDGEVFLRKDNFISG